MNPGDEATYGRGLASVLREIEAGDETRDTARQLRAEIDAYRSLLDAHERTARDHHRAEVERTRTLLEQLMGGRPVRGGALVILDGGQPI
jgi:uncharacterized protein YlxW (UPF0749 family)